MKCGQEIFPDVTQLFLQNNWKMLSLEKIWVQDPLKLFLWEILNRLENALSKS